MSHLKGYVAIPKASTRERIVSNTKIFDFELDQADIDLLDALDEGLLSYSTFEMRITDFYPSTRTRYGLGPNGLPLKI
jgi:diketogulonate reductase-like aldo/keto reductase